jgi:hypothetical protein
VILFLVSRGKWADAIIDTGNEWLWPDALARGELLYRDVVYWFGPLTPYVHAAAFGLFGSSFASLVLAGAVASILTLAALSLCLRLVTGRPEAALWTVLAIPLLVFMPFSGGSLLGMGYRMWHAAALTLLALWVALSPRGARWRPWIAGVLVGLAALCRAEWGAIALVALAAGMRRRGAGWRVIARSTVAAAVVFVAVMAPFVAAAGLERFLTESFVFLVGLPAETRSSAVGWMGVRRWPWGVWSWIYASTLWIAVYGLIETAATRRGRATTSASLRDLAPLYAALAVLLAGAVAGQRVGSVALAWIPAACVAAIVVGWRRRARGALLVACGLVGLLGCARRMFDLRDFGYVAPPALFALVCAAGLVRLAARRRPRAAAPRRRLRRFVRIGLVVLIAGAFLDRISRYANDSRVPIPGTDGFLAASPGLARALERTAAEVRRRTPEGGSLVVFPDGAVLNFLSGRRNSLRHKLYVAGFLRASNEDAVLRELAARPPDAVVVLDRPDGYDPPRVFGRDYGSRVRRWLEEWYDLAPVAGTTAEPAGFPLLLGFPKPAAAQPYNPAP